MMDIVAIGNGPPAGERNTEFHGTYVKNVPDIILKGFDTNHEPVNFQRFGNYIISICAKIILHKANQSF